jgi:hypothetical protein
MKDQVDQVELFCDHASVRGYFEKNFFGKYFNYKKLKELLIYKPDMIVQGLEQPYDLV